MRRQASFCTRAAIISVVSGIYLNVLPTAVFASGKAPQIATPPSLKATVGTAFSYMPDINDPERDRLKVALINGPGWLKIDRATGRIFGTPSSAAKYSSLVYTANDGTKTARSRSFTLVVEKNAAPRISGTPQPTGTVNSYYQFKPVAKDANGDTLKFSIDNKPAWAKFSSATGRLHGTPTAAGSFDNIRIKVSDGRSSSALPAFKVTIKGGSQAPVISGTPPTSVVAGSNYAFTPAVSNPNGATVSFNISNKPKWASFNTLTGKLTGTPTLDHLGSYTNITVSVTSGNKSASLAPFSVTVNRPADEPGSSGAATLSWTPPTQNTDGTVLKNLAGYRVYYGTKATALTQVIDVPNASMSIYMVENLAAGTYFFAVKAYNTQSVESGLSNVVSKTVK